MIIYIYGNDDFKKEIHSVLNHANIKFRLDEHGQIVDLKSLDELKKAIEENPKNIYLIDDDKIIKKNSLNEKIKLLRPKDGIEQEYLLDHGIGDISVDSVEELSKHIIKRLDSFAFDKESEDIQNSIVEIVEDAYENDKKSEDYIQLDDELSTLLSHEEEPKKGNKESKDLSFDKDLDSILDIEENMDTNYEESSVNEIDTLGVEEIGENDMSNEFSEFDTLNEEDLLAALGDMDKVEVPMQKSSKEDFSSPVSKSSNEVAEMSVSNVNDIAELISKLLNNKTLEITVKVKD